jgi:hypothetical protein
LQTAGGEFQIWKHLQLRETLRQITVSFKGEDDLSELGGRSRSVEKSGGMTNTNYKVNYYNAGSGMDFACIVVGNDIYDVLKSWK